MKVFYQFWAIYAIVLFLILMFCSLPVIALYMIFTPGEKALKYNIYYLHHIFTPVFLALIGIRVKVEGKEHLEKGRSYVIVGNHRSSLDFIINAVAFPGVFRFLAKEDLQKIPVFGWVVKKMCLTVDRRSAMSRARSVVALKQQLAEGWSIFIYPEGSRNKSDAPLAEFYDGAFRIAIQTGAPLAIQTITNITNVASVQESLHLRPGTVRIIWEKPLETNNLNATDVSTLKVKVWETMASKIEI